MYTVSVSRRCLKHKKSGFRQCRKSSTRAATTRKATGVMMLVMKLAYAACSEPPEYRHSVETTADEPPEANDMLEKTLESASGHSYSNALMKEVT